MKFPPWWGYGYYLELHNGRKMKLNWKFQRMGVQMKKKNLHGGGMDIFIQS